jgi:hypothetical protein
MSEGLPIRQITIIRIITMSAGVLGSLVMLLEYNFFSLGPAHWLTFPSAPVAMVGVLCLLNLLRHLLVLRRLARERPATAG